jgi:FMN-dependent NADH-azoreductase
LFITSRGADLRAGSPYQEMDAPTPALKAAFGFLGVAAPTFVDAQPLEFANPDAREQALERARDELSAVAAQWAEWARSVQQGRRGQPVQRAQSANTANTASGAAEALLPACEE